VKGLSVKELPELAETLARFQTPKVETEKRRTGHIIIPGDDVRVMPYGKVAAVQSRHGTALTIDGPGRVVVTIGNEV